MPDKMAAAATHWACSTPRAEVNPRARKNRLIAQKSEVQFDGKSCLQERYSEVDASSESTLNLHMGQRKLLLSEIQLLTEYYKVAGAPHPTLVYVGSAPGTHLLFLHELFPKVRFVLYDGSRFDPGLLSPAKSSVFEVHNTFFLDSTCDELARRLGSKTPIVFVSDIRSDAREAGSFEDQVMWDMLSQRRWAERLKPSLSLLKFRLPFTLRATDSVKYLPGRLLFGIWPPRMSAETRLLVRAEELSKPDVAYPYGPYESALFFHNRYTRSMCFADALPDNLRSIIDSGDTQPQYCGCYDCASELLVYQGYAGVAMAAGRPDLVDVRAALDAYAKHARAHHAPLPKVVRRPAVGDNGNEMRKRAEASIAACRKQQEQ